MRRKYRLYDFIAALAFVFEVDWEKELPPDGYEDYLWDTAPKLRHSVSGREEAPEQSAG